jgi:hypothetical protein
MISERGETETSPLIYLRTIDTQPRAVSLPHSAPARSTKRGQHSGRDDADNAYEYEWRTHGRQACLLGPRVHPPAAVGPGPAAKDGKPVGNMHQPEQLLAAVGGPQEAPAHKGRRADAALPICACHTRSHGALLSVERHVLCQWTPVGWPFGRTLATLEWMVGAADLHGRSLRCGVPAKQRRLSTYNSARNGVNT